MKTRLRRFLFESSSVRTTLGGFDSSRDGLAEAPPAQAHVEAVLRLKPSGYLVVGWSTASSVDLLTWIMDLADVAADVCVARHPRTDISLPCLEPAGFVAIIPQRDGPSTWSADALVQCGQQGVRDFTLGDMAFIMKLFPPQGDQSTTEIMQRCLTSLDPTLSTRAEYAEFFSTSSRVENPRCSIVIPIYGNFRMAELLIVCLDHSRSREVDELILVVDNAPGEQAAEDWISLMRLKANRLFQIPITCVRSSSNGGFAQAVNAGVSFSRGDFVSVLNSDIFPPIDEPDPVGVLVKAIQQDVVLVAPISLYPDRSVQHAGCHLVRRRDLENAILVEHPGKGMPVGDLPDNPLLSGAALCFRRFTFSEVGGMPLRYGKGDFEDIEFSLLMGRLGRISIIPDQFWTHVEGASYGVDSGRTLEMTLMRSRIFENWLLSQSEVVEIHE